MPAKSLDKRDMRACLNMVDEIARVDFNIPLETILRDQDGRRKRGDWATSSASQ